MLMCMGIPNVLRVKFSSQGFLKQMSRSPAPHWIQNSADCCIYIYIICLCIYIYICIYLYMLAFCCGDPTLRTSQMLTYTIPTFDGIYFVAIVDRSAWSVLYSKVPIQGFGCSQKSKSNLYIYIYIRSFFFYLYVNKFHAVFIEL